MKIVVMGTGGVGGYFGGLLAKAGEDVTFIARGPHLEALRTHGLTVKSKPDGDFTLRVHAIEDPHAMKPVDLVLFCIKTYDTVAAAELIRPVVGEHTVILSTQNGIDQAQHIDEVLKRQIALSAAVYISAHIESPGVIAHVGSLARILLGEREGGQSSRTELIYHVFRTAGIAAELPPDIRLALWEKFMLICAFSGITALLRQPVGQVLAYQETRDLIQMVMQEGETIARACGVELPADVVMRKYDSFKTLDPAAIGSMATDLLAQHRLEVEALNGTIVRLGRELKIATPYNFVIYAALKPYSNGQPDSLKTENQIHS